jgi:hypothetical protein
MGVVNYNRRAELAWARYRDLLNRAELARRLGISPVSIHHWRVVPQARLAKVSQLLGVKPGRLRPDLYREKPEPWDDFTEKE